MMQLLNTEGGFYSETPDPKTLIKARKKRPKLPGDALDIYQLWWRAIRLANNIPEIHWHGYTQQELGVPAKSAKTFEEWMEKVDHNFKHAPWLLVQEITTVEEGERHIKNLNDEELILVIQVDMPRPHVLAEIKKRLNAARKHDPKAGNPQNREMLSEFPILKIADGPAIKRLIDVFEESLSSPNDKTLAKILHENMGYPLMAKSDLSKARKKARRLIQNAAYGKFPDYTGEYSIQENGIAMNIKLRDARLSKLNSGS